MPPRSGYDLSDDPDDVGSEDGSNSERESVGTNDEDHEGSEYDDEDIADADDAAEEDDDDDDDAEHSARGDRRQVNGDHESDDRQRSEEQSPHGQLSRSAEEVNAAPERPVLPKRPSLTRHGIVPPPINVVDHMRSPMDPLAQAEQSARALAAQKASTGSAMLNFFRDEQARKSHSRSQCLAMPRSRTRSCQRLWVLMPEKLSRSMP